jgi:hypothetical protein
MLGLDECNCIGLSKGSKNYGSSIIIHEHDFEPVKTKEDEQNSIICLTCDSLYCKICGKILASTPTNDRKKIHNKNNLYNHA